MKNALLWRLTPHKGGPDSYLFGTMHVRDLRAFNWLDRAKHCLDKCDVFATEFDFSDSDPNALATVLQGSDQGPLDETLKPGAWKSLQRLCKKRLGVPAEHMRFSHPMAVSMALTNSLLADETNYSLDETLWNYAREQGKQTTGVETFEEQLDILGKIPYKQHLKSLTWLLKNYKRQKKRLRKMMHWYNAGELQKLYRAAKKDAKGMRKILLFDRNQLMADRVVEIASQQSLFCAVGAGHLAGEKGMLRLLKKAGFKVRPVKRKQQ